VEPADEEGDGGTEQRLRPVLEGRRVLLRPVSPGDYELLRRVELAPHLAYRWRHRGATPGMANWIQAMEQSVLAQFLIVDRRSGEEEWVGLVSVYDPSFQHGFAHLAAAKLGESDRSTRALEGVVLFLDYVFRSWSFRKLYAETPEYNLDQFGSGIGRILTEEGRLPEHWYLDGRYWDQVILAIRRETWEERGPGMVRVCRGEAGAPT